MRPRITIVGGIALLSLTLVACGSDDMGSSGSDSSARSSTPAASDAGDDVSIKLIAYTPKQRTVDAGTTVTWRQLDPGSHTVTSGRVEQGSGGVQGMPDGAFSSGELTTGQDFEFEFTKPGTYPYFCEIHPATMRGEITVR